MRLSISLAMLASTAIVAAASPVAAPPRPAAASPRPAGGPVGKQVTSIGKCPVRIKPR
jgi:hypothetical protein